VISAAQSRCSWVKLPVIKNVLFTFPVQRRDQIVKALCFRSRIECKRNLGFSQRSALGFDEASDNNRVFWARRSSFLSTCGVGARPNCPNCTFKTPKNRTTRLRANSAPYYIIRRFNASLAVLKSPWGCTFAETPRGLTAQSSGQFMHRKSQPSVARR
jgi:hypothetical protein